MHQRRVAFNKLIEQHLSYQDCNKLITNLNHRSTRKQQKMTTNTGYLSKTMAIIIHTCNGTTPYYLQRFSLFQMNNTIVQQHQHLNPSSNSLGRGGCSQIYTKYRPSSPGGVQFRMESSEINRWRVHQCITEARLSLLVNRGLD